MPSLPPDAPSRPVIVLSAGGPVAWLFHLGVLSGLETRGYRLADAHLIGTSAGSAVAALVKSGAGLEQARDAIMTPPDAGDRREILDAMRTTGRELVGPGLAGRVRPLAPRFLRQALPGGRGVAMAIAGVLPSGIFSNEPLGSMPSLESPEGDDRWPDGLWIPAVDAQTGDVAVFGRDASEATVADAVAASSAVPGLFQPKELDGREFIDGAVSSSTHAALAAELSPDLVIVSSVQTRGGRRPIRIGARRRLRDEVAVLAAQGIPAVVIEPDEDARAAEPLVMRPGFSGADRIYEAGERLANEALSTASERVS